MNKVQLYGNLGQDPELKYTGAGTPIVNFSIATREGWKDSEGNKQERTTWHKCFMFGSRAETIAQYFKKGSPILISDAAIRNESYAKEDGTTAYTSKIEVKDFEFVGSNGNNSGTTENSEEVRGPAKKGAPAANRPAKKGAANSGTPSEGRKPAAQPDTDDELPF